MVCFDNWRLLVNSFGLLSSVIASINQAWFEPDMELRVTEKIENADFLSLVDVSDGRQVEKMAN